MKISTADLFEPLLLTLKDSAQAMLEDQVQRDWTAQDLADMRIALINLQKSMEDLQRVSERVRKSCPSGKS